MNYEATMKDLTDEMIDDACRCESSRCEKCSANNSDADNREEK